MLCRAGGELSSCICRTTGENATLSTRTRCRGGRRSSRTSPRYLRLAQISCTNFTRFQAVFLRECVCVCGESGWSWGNLTCVSLLQDAIEDKLDAKRYPFLSGGSRSMGMGAAPVRCASSGGPTFCVLQENASQCGCCDAKRVLGEQVFFCLGFSRDANRPRIERLALTLKLLPILQRALRAVAQGARSGQLQDGAAAPRLHPGRLFVLRDANCVRSDEYGQELGSHHR